MLAVVPASIDLATQGILELAAEADVHGDRTLGVLTKPDLVDRGAESGVACSMFSVQDALTIICVTTAYTLLLCALFMTRIDRYVSSGTAWDKIMSIRISIAKGSLYEACRLRA
jgi:hypothetical protein